MELSVAICDDESKEVEYLKALAGKWAFQRKHKLNVQSFPSAEAFLFCYEEKKDFDILLLDIQMQGMDGIALARKIRETGDAVQIVFITGFDEYISEGYEVSALHYLMKPVSEEKLFSVLDRAFEAIKKTEPTVILNVDGESVKLKLSDILCVEASAHTSIVRTLRGSLAVNQSITQFSGLLGKAFFRCHRSYIVNLLHVSRIGKSEVVLDDKSFVPLSRRQYDEMNRAFIDYYRK